MSSSDQDKLKQQPARKGDWITTYSGKKFYPMDPRPEDIDTFDIAQSLARLCRFNGHCTTFYSVAQHCVLVSLMCDPKDALWGLIHDASEAYVGDIPTPIKRLPEFAFYREAEDKVQNLICDCFNLPYEKPVSVSLADKRILATEARDLTMTEGRNWTTAYDPYDIHIKPWTPEHATIKYISRLHELTLKRSSK